jgi:hypothetical protein
MGHTRSSKKSLIKRSRNGREHIVNCDKGYFKASHEFTEIHHMVCVSSMSDATIRKLVADSGKMEFIRECLKLTDWNINAEPNTVGLPKKPAFVKRNSSDWNGWPCHQVDHNPLYTKAVSSRLNKQVWQEVLKNRTKCKDCKKECNINASSVQTQLEGESDFWHDFLDTRGEEEGGTAFCWKHRKSIPDVWYIPFSMDPSDAPPKRDPPPEWDGLSSTLKNYLSKIMFKFV